MGNAGRYMASETREIVYSRCNPCEAFVVLGARLPAVGQRIVLRTHLIRTKMLQQIGLAVHHADVRTKKLIRGAG